MQLQDYLENTKENFVIIDSKERRMMLSGKPQDLRSMLSIYLLKAKVLKVEQEIEDFPYIIVIDCEVIINASKR